MIYFLLGVSITANVLLIAGYKMFVDATKKELEAAKLKMQS